MSLGKGHGHGTRHLIYRPHSSYLVLDITFLWFGWFGFNSGPALSANLPAITLALSRTCPRRALAGLVWILSGYRLGRNWLGSALRLSPASSESHQGQVLSALVGVLYPSHGLSLKQNISSFRCCPLRVGPLLGGTACNFVSSSFATMVH